MPVARRAGWRRRSFLAAPVAALGVGRARATQPMVLLGFDGELGVEGSTSAQAIVAGIEIALAEVNAAGGVLGGRKLSLLTRDNRAMPARAAQNLRELAATPSLAAVFCGRYSPTALENVPLVHELGLPLLSPWASADGIIDHGREPSWTFRLSMADRWALPLMADHAARRGRRTLGLLAVNTGWGRSAERALALHLGTGSRQRMVTTRWFNYTDSTEVIAGRYAELVDDGIDALLFIGNFREGAELVQAVAALPPSRRRLLMAHAGVMGGDFFGACGDALKVTEVAVIQSFGFAGASRPRAAAVRAAAHRRLGGSGRVVPSAAGLAQAYDLTHLLARAIDAARSSEREAVRSALERSRPWSGLIRDYPVPFTPARHDALTPGDLYMARFEPDGALVRVR